MSILDSKKELVPACQGDDGRLPTSHPGRPAINNYMLMKMIMMILIDTPVLNNKMMMKIMQLLARVVMGGFLLLIT